MTYAAQFSKGRGKNALCVREAPFFCEQKNANISQRPFFGQKAAIPIKVDTASSRVSPFFFYIIILRHIVSSLRCKLDLQRSKRKLFFFLS